MAPSAPTNPHTQGDLASFNDLPGFDDVRAASERILGRAHRTPVLTSQSLNDHFGAELFFKCENLQRAGAFKFRGACNAVFALSTDELTQGVGTHSSGNHAAALSLAAKMRQTRAVIVMPDDAPSVKKAAVRGYGGEIVFCEPTLESRETTLAEIVAREHLHVVHPYDNPWVIAGQGTAALELIEDCGPLDAVITPIGGGGLLSGTALSTSALLPNAQVYGAEPQRADDAWRSLAAGHIIPVGKTDTIADGLRTSLGERNFTLLREHGVNIVTASEEAIIDAMRFIWERLKVVIEPSAALPLAVMAEQRGAIEGQRIGIILSGGNLDLDTLPFGAAS